ETSTRLWDMGKSAAGVLVPKTAMDKNEFSPLGKGNVGSPRRIVPLGSKSITAQMQQAPDNELGFRVAAAYARHMGASLRRTQFGSHLIGNLALHPSAKGVGQVPWTNERGIGNRHSFGSIRQPARPPHGLAK